MADETTDILMDETEDYSFEPEANEGLIPTEVVEEESEFLDPDDEETINESEASVAAPSTTAEIEDPANIALPLPTGMDITTYTSYEDDTPDNVGTPGEEAEDVPEPSGEVVILRNKLKAVTTTYNEPIPGVITPEIITKINELNARVYAVLDDDTRVQCEVTDVFVPDGPPTVQYVNQGTVIASAINQHFWHNSEGAHVTDDSQDDWSTEYAKTDHGELANPTLNRPWHNILMNSYGFLIRKGLLWLSQQSVGATLFYDGTGNTVNNVVAGFTTDEVQIGKLTDKHLIIDTDGLHAYDENGNDASITARLAGSYIEDSTITGSKIADSTITGSKIVGSTLTDIPYAEIDALKARNISADAISAATAFVAALSAASIAASDISADHATIGSLSTNYAHITNGTIDNAKIGHADVNGLSANYAEINMANVNNAWLQNGTIKDAAISDGMINSVSANKLTAGTIDASNITVTNLNADNITAGTLNGQRIGDGSLSLDKLADDVYTESEVDGLLATMQSEIDGAIETWTGTVVPTLNNVPASGWSTNSDKDKHVGDVYFVVNSQSQQNGYNYRFTKSGNTYSWQLIKDTDITNALSRLSTAEGKITTFDSDITTLKTDTGTLRTKTQSLETSLGDKVDVTTFNDLEDTVEGHSQTILQHTTAISNKADGSTVTALTNRVSKNEQDISGINTTISELSTTVESKADGSTVETVSNRLNTVSDTVNGHTSQLSSITNTQTSIQGSAVKSTVQLWFTKANTTAPNKPTAHVTTNNASTANAWNLAVPTYNASYPNYFYCYEYEYLNGTYGWSAVTRDIATGEAQSTARTAASDASTAKTNASTAVSTANTANTNASNAVSTANTANTNASNAVSTANTAASDASTAKTNAATAVSTANTANTNASNAVTTANTAKSTADKNLRESQQLWFTKANSTAPGKPTSKVTSTATTGNAWTTKVPTYNASYKYYFYCMQYIAADGTVTWSDVIYDQATTEAQSVARAASSDLTEFHQEYATFKQTTQNFESTVGETYATKTEMAEAAKQYDSDTEAPLVVGDNAATAPLRSYEGMGHAEQFTTTGKNLLNVTYSSNQLFSVNADGSIVVTQAPDSGGSWNIATVHLDANTTYTLSGASSVNERIFLRSVTDVGNVMCSGTPNTFTAAEAQDVLLAFVLTTSATVGTKLYPQLELGSTATDYEPYTGGAPSPSPDYPQDIQVVRGRNLLDASTLFSDLGGLKSKSLQLAPNMTYVMSTTLPKNSGNAANLFVYKTGESANTRINGVWDGQSRTVTTGSDGIAIIGYRNDGYTDTSLAWYLSHEIQLELGSTPTPYVPYGHVGLEAQGRNLIDEDSLVQGAISNTGDVNNSARVRSGRISLSVGSTYTISAESSLGAVRYAVSTYASTSENRTSEIAWAQSGTSFTVPDGISYVRVVFRIGGGATAVTPSDIRNVQLELGSVAHDYEPYYHATKPIPLPSRGWVASLPDGTADVLMLDGAGKVEWELNDAEVVLDGSENWTANGTNGYLISANAGVIPDCKYAITGQTPVMSNLYQNKTPTWTDSSFGIENRIIWVGDRNSARFGSLDGFKAFLASTNMTIFYPLATPTTEECGYINMPQVSEGCAISIPELEDSGISWWCKASESMANVTTAIEKRVTTTETSITQTKEQILLKANSSDVYTKTQTDGLISTEVTNRNAAIQLASNSITSTVEQSYSKQQSRGIQLVTNGNGFMGDNTNWSKLTFDGSKTNGSPGSFTKSIVQDTVLSDELIPVDPSKEYLFEFDAISADGTARIYSMLVMYDVDKNNILAPNVMYYQNTLTTLAADLKPGDTTVKLTSAANWTNTTATHQRSLIFWDYTNRKGYTYPEETYSRNYYAGIYTNDSSVNKATGVITLKTAWTGPKKLAGTKVSQNTSGSQYAYAIQNVAVPNEWTHYKFVYSGLDITKNGYDDRDATKLIGKFRQGTAFVKPGFLWNYGHTSSAPQGQLWVTNISVKENVATSTEVEEINTVVQQTANNVLIKATQSDTTAAQGGQHLIQSLINVAPSGVKISTSKLDITGDAVFSAINNDTGTTKISGGKIDATSITLGYSQITNTPSIPTKTSDLTNDSSYATTSQAQGYANAKDTAIAAAAKRTYVSIRATAVDYAANTATLEATLYIDGVATTTNVTYAWLKDGTAISGATSRTYSVPASNGLDHAYSCKCVATV